MNNSQNYSSNSFSCQEIIDRLKAVANPNNVAGMARFGIKPHSCLGISTPFLRALAREIGRNHALALELWQSGIHEARILATMIADPHKMSPEDVEQWVHDFDSWDVCDQACINLLKKLPFATDKIIAWSTHQEEFVKRAAFALIATLAHDKKKPDTLFISFFPLIKQAADDERNFVKKAVNWALRQIGKRNQSLNNEAQRIAEELLATSSKSAHWIAQDARRELKKHL